MKIYTRFLLSATDAMRFPVPGPPEIAFLGRSNVGKSSLINSLVGSKIAKTSNTPGRTQAINFFEVRWPGRPKPDLLFVDLPGYGFARVPKDVSSQWRNFVDPYLTERSALSLCLCLVDANIAPQPNDAHLVEFLRHVNRPFLIVATKADKVGSRLQTSLKALRQELGVEDLLPFSAKTGFGKDDLWKAIRRSSELPRWDQGNSEGMSGTG